MTQVIVHGKHRTEWVTISKDEYESLNETIAVLSDNDLMMQINKGKQKGIKSRNFEDITKELGI